jgi:hypothetical protein
MVAGKGRRGKSEDGEAQRGKWRVTKTAERFHVRPLLIQSVVDKDARASIAESES